MNSVEIEKHTDRIFPHVPRVGVGVVIFKKDQIVLVQRQNHPAQGEWSIPGGLVNIGETVRQAAQREIREECSLEIDNLEILDVFEYIENKNDSVKYHFIVLDYVADWKSGKLKAGSDAPQAQWVSVSDLDQISMKPQLKKMLTKALSKKMIQ